MKPTNPKILLPGIALSLLMGGCQQNNNPENSSTFDANTQTGLTTKSRLKAVDSDNQLEQYLKQGFSNPNNFIINFTDMGTSLTADNAEATSSESSTATNLQVNGVDEADRIKNDGQYLYSIKQPDHEYTIDAIGPVVTMANASPQATQTPTISVHQIQANPAASHLLTEVKVDEANAAIKGLYLTTDQGGNGEQLIATGSAGQGWVSWYSPWSWQSTQTKLWFYDVSEAAAPQQSHNISIDGYLLSSRRVEDTLYLVTRFTPSIEGYLNFPSTDAETAENQALLEQSTLNDLLPTVSINQNEPQQLLLSHNCFIPDTTENNGGYPTLTSITAINLNSPEEMVSACYGGRGDGVYASTQNIYLTTATDKDSDSNGLDEISFSNNTAIHKFALNSHGPSYQGSGIVPGSLSISGSNPAFLMGERDGVLHVVTSRFNNNQWQHQLTNLQSNADNSQLEIIAQLPNKTNPAVIGKPGERIYAARYIGDRAYLVTFKKVDPLYIIDLSDNNKPLIAGELELPGYSSYLHAVNDGLLLGIGKDAIADEAGNFSWYQGLKLSLFDVSDINAPAEISSVILGDRGTNSPVLNNHHSLSYLASSEGTDKFSIPVSLYQGGEQTSPWQWADWQHDGLYLFEINTDSQNASLRHSGTLIGEQASSTNTWGSGSYDDRAVIQDSAVHYLHNNNVISADWDSVTP